MSASPERAAAFGRRLKALRKDQRMTQVELAKAAFISRQYVAVLEMGRNIPSVEVAENLARALGVAPEYLLLGVQPTPEDTDSIGTNSPLTERHTTSDDTEQRLRRIELRLEESSPTVEVIGRVPADTLRWASIGDVYTVEVSRVQLGNARAPFGLEVTGNCFRESVGLHAGDIVICEPPFGRDPHDRQIVVIRVGDEVTLKRWCVVDGEIELRDGDENVVHTLSPGDDFEVQGFYVTYLPLAPR